MEHEPCLHDRRLRTDATVSLIPEYTERCGPDHRVVEIRVTCLDCGAIAWWRGHAPFGMSPIQPMRAFPGDELRVPVYFRRPTDEEAKEIEGRQQAEQAMKERRG